jgi:error-prone DNA polymerase
MVPLVPMTEGHHVVEDYHSVGLTLRSHPVSFLRDEFTEAGMVPCADLTRIRDGRRVTVAGLVQTRQRPGTAKGVMFITIGDETGYANLIIWPNVFEQQRRVIMSGRMIACRGQLQKEGLVIHVIATLVTDLTDRLATLTARPSRYAMARPTKPGMAAVPIHA